MSFRWPNKDPDEQLDYSVDWSRFLDDGTTTPPTITEVTWFIQSTLYDTKTEIDQGETFTTASGGATTDNMQHVTKTKTGTVATINLAGGQNNVEYTFTCRITFGATNRIAERTVKLKVKER